MALKAAMWTHGTIAEAEYPDRLHPAPSGVVRRGWGATFTGQVPGEPENWIHIPIPTPVILDDARLNVAKVFVLYKTNYARITNVALWDGARPVTTIDDLDLSGDHSFEVDAQNSWTLDPPVEIQFGLGLSVRVLLEGLLDWGPGVILIATAGADFEIK